jgi:ABC-type nitrate/sulfonate/bicarbonate transport system substrate-binding protein
MSRSGIHHRVKGIFSILLMFFTLLLPVFGQGVQDDVRESAPMGQSEKSVTFTVSTPPDPNFIPIAVLAAKADEWIPGITVKMVTAPAGDPSAMRALAQNRAVDFSLFNLHAGSKFYATGMSHMRLIGSHVWKGVYLLAQESVMDVSELNGETLFAVPAIMTPPHIISEKALNLGGVTAEFLPAGSGPSLFALLSQPDKAPKAFAAPEPMVSIILSRQQKENWPITYRVLMDPQRVLDPVSGEVPTGSLWLLNPGILDSEPDAVEAFIDGFDRANSYAVDPLNSDEVAAIVAKALAEVYDQSANTQVYVDMLKSGRLGLNFRRAEEIRDIVLANLRSLYDMEVDEGMFYIAGSSIPD